MFAIDLDVVAVALAHQFQCKQVLFSEKKCSCGSFSGVVAVAVLSYIKSNASMELEAVRGY